MQFKCCGSTTDIRQNAMIKNNSIRKFSVQKQLQATNIVCVCDAFWWWLDSIESVWIKTKWKLWRRESGQNINMNKKEKKNGKKEQQHRRSNVKDHWKRDRTLHTYTYIHAKAHAYIAAKHRKNIFSFVSWILIRINIVFGLVWSEDWEAFLLRFLSAIKGRKHTPYNLHQHAYV